MGVLRTFYPVTTKVLSAAAEHGDEIQVVVVGTDCDDVKEVK